jgi:transcriptional regulator with XRE-family HTH domain
MAFGEWLGEQLKQREWSYYKMARLANISESQVRDIVANDRDSRVDTVYAICAILGEQYPGPDFLPAPVDNIATRASPEKRIRAILKEEGVTPEGIRAVMGTVELVLEKAKGSGRAAV